jgi:DNA-binding NtrC family response regulator
VEPQFLLIDDNRDGRCIIARAVQRKYREALLHEFPAFAAAAPALARLAANPAGLIVVTGRTSEHDPVALVAAVRAVHSGVPIIAMGRNEATAALAAGATHFLEYDAWLLLGNLIERVIGEEGTDGLGAGADPAP